MRIVAVGRRPNDSNVCFADRLIPFVKGNWMEAVWRCMEDQLALVQEALTETVFLVAGMNPSKQMEKKNIKTRQGENICGRLY